MKCGYCQQDRNCTTYDIAYTSPFILRDTINVCWECEDAFLAQLYKYEPEVVLEK